MVLLRILLAAAFAASAPVSLAAETPLPAGIGKLVAGYADECRKLGGSLAKDRTQPGILAADLDGDGTLDYILNPQNLSCSAAATAYCGNGGCRILIALSRSGYREPVEVLGGQPTVSDREDGTYAEIWVDGSSCKLKDRTQACWASYSWRDGKFKPVYEARPIS